MNLISRPLLLWVDVCRYYWVEIMGLAIFSGVILLGWFFGDFVGRLWLFSAFMAGWLFFGLNIVLMINLHKNVENCIEKVL